MDFFIWLDMQWLIDQKTQNSNLKRKEMHMKTRKVG